MFLLLLSVVAAGFAECSAFVSAGKYIAPVQQQQLAANPELGGADEELDSTDSSEGNQFAPNRSEKPKGYAGLRLRKLMRPSAGAGPEEVRFSVYCLWVGAMDMVRGRFDADIVVTLWWHDPRAGKIVPEGHEEVTVDNGHARQLFWVPDVVVTNREPFSFRIISTSYTVTASGDVTKVQRAMVACRHPFDPTFFPFDSHTFEIVVASSKYLANELHLTPWKDKSAFGVDPDAFNHSDFEFIEADLHSEDETDGMLHKSRGIFSVCLKRLSWPYVQSLLWPEIQILIISWTSFWYPLQAPFVMPRVFTALVSFLTLLMLAIKNDGILPVRGTISWMGTFETVCQSLTFFNVCLDLFMLIVTYQMDELYHGLLIQEELKFILPALAAFLLGICGITSQEPEHLVFLGLFSEIILAAFFLTFVGYQGIKFHKGCEQEKDAKPLKCVQVVSERSPNVAKP